MRDGSCSVEIDLACTILHVDMDAFFAAVELLDRPELAGKAVIVGGTGARGVVAACTYEARVFGIRSGMPSIEARRRCPQAVVLSGRFDRYMEVSSHLHALLETFTPVIEGIALDEAFLNVAGARSLLGSPFEIAVAIRKAVRDELRLDCAVGIGRSKLIAKLASRAAKPVVTPDGPVPGPGVVMVRQAEELGFLHPLPVRALWGVGPSTARRLDELGIASVGDLAVVPDATMCRLFGKSGGMRLVELARGEDLRPVVANAPSKSISHVETFPVDLRDGPELRCHLLRLSDAVGTRLGEADLAARTVGLSVRFADLTSTTRSHTPDTAVTTTRSVVSVSSALLDEVDSSGGIRLLGVSVSGLVDRQEAMSAPLQLTFLALDSGSDSGDSSPEGSAEGICDTDRVGVLAEDFRHGHGGDHDTRERLSLPSDLALWQEIEAAVGAVRARYGHRSVGPAALIGPGGLKLKRRGETQWGPAAPDASGESAKEHGPS